MKEHPDHHDAELMLRLYDLRREQKLRQARDWFFREFHADSMEDLMKRYPFGSEENAYYRMTVSYWEMAASIVNHGLINEELFFESQGEFFGVWTKIERLVPSVREAQKNPMSYRNLEELAKKFEKWISSRAPGATAVVRDRLKMLTAKK